MKKQLIFLCIPFIILTACPGQNTGSSRSAPEQLVLVSWNVQNIFDGHDDGTEYPDFDPGEGAWNEELYSRRLENAGKVLRAVNGGEGADIIILEEIENRRVLRDLRTGPLAGMGYRYEYITDNAGQAIQIGVLSRYQAAGVSSFYPGSFRETPLRQILELRLELGGETLYLFCNHWKSRRGGEEETEPGRIRSSSLLEIRFRRLLLQDPDTLIILAGDLNECWDEYSGAYQTALMPADAAVSPEGSLFVTDLPAETGLSASRVTLYSPWPGSLLPGSYRYRDRWETIDHFLLAPGLFSGNGWEFRDFSVFAYPEAVNDQGYPFRWITDYGTGYSDHLTVVLILGHLE
jgi:hypothetical protein